MNQKNIEKICHKYNVNPQQIDTKALWDNTLTKKENYKKLRQEIRKHSNNKVKTSEYYKEIDKYQQQQQEHNKETIQKEKQELQEKQRKAIKKIARNKNTNIAKHYKELRELIKTTSNKHSNALIVKSKAGLGKTYQTLQTLQEQNKTLNDDYIYINTYATPLEFYRTLYRNKDKLIILDDIEGVLKNKRTIGMLKSALWSTSGEREIQYRSSKLPSDLPDRFNFDGQVIILCNELKLSGEDIEALKNRCLYHELNFSHKEKLEIMSKLGNKDLGKNLNKKEKQEILKYIEKVITPAHRFNLRNYMKSLEIYKHNPSYWKPLVKEQLEYEKKEELETLLEIMDKGYSTTKEEIKEFQEKTGKSRRTYYNYKKKLLDRKT